MTYRRSPFRSIRQQLRWLMTLFGGARRTTLKGETRHG